MAVGIPTLSSLLDINILTVISKVDRTWSERSGLSKCTNKEFNSDKVITSWFLIIYTWILCNEEMAFCDGQVMLEFLSFPVLLCTSWTFAEPEWLSLISTGVKKCINLALSVLQISSYFISIWWKSLSLINEHSFTCMSTAPMLFNLLNSDWLNLCVLIPCFLNKCCKLLYDPQIFKTAWHASIKMITILLFWTNRGTQTASTCFSLLLALWDLFGFKGLKSGSNCFGELWSTSVLISSVADPFSELESIARGIFMLVATEKSSFSLQGSILNSFFYLSEVLCLGKLLCCNRNSSGKNSKP